MSGKHSLFFFCDCIYKCIFVIMTSSEQITCIGDAFIIPIKIKKSVEDGGWDNFYNKEKFSGKCFVFDLNDDDLFNNLTRISSSDFELLLNLIGLKVSKKIHTIFQWRLILNQPV